MDKRDSMERFDGIAEKTEKFDDVDGAGPDIELNSDPELKPDPAEAEDALPALSQPSRSFSLLRWCCGPDDTYDQLWNRGSSLGVVVFVVSGVFLLAAWFTDEYASPSDYKFNTMCAAVAMAVGAVFTVTRQLLEHFLPTRKVAIDAAAFALFFVALQIRIFQMPTMSPSAYNLCEQLRQDMTQDFSDYTFPTTYHDIMSVADIYAFIKGPVLSDTIFTSDDLYVSSFLSGYMITAANQNWNLAGDLRIRQVRAERVSYSTNCSLEFTPPEDSGSGDNEGSGTARRGPGDSSSRDNASMSNSTSQTVPPNENAVKQYLCSDGCCRTKAYSSSVEEKSSIESSSGPSGDGEPRSGPSGGGGDPFNFNDNKYPNLNGREVSGVSSTSVMDHSISYGRGGYTVFVPLSPDATLAKSQEQIESLSKITWIDSQTRAVFVEFTVAAPVADLMVSVTATIEQDPSGRVQPSALVTAVTHNSFDADYWYDGYGRGIKEFAWDWAMAAFISHFICQVLICVFSYLLPEWLELKKEGFKAHFSDAWNVFDAIWLLLSLSSLALICVAQYFWPNIYTDDFFDVDNPERYIDLYGSAYCIQISCKILAFVLVLVCFRALEYISISPRLKQISATFSHSLKNIAAFALFFVVCLVGFAEAFMLVFSVEHEDYSTLLNSIYGCIRAFVGDIDATALKKADWLFGPLFFILYIFVMFFVMLTVLIAIVSEGYEDAKLEVAQMENGEGGEIESEGELLVAMRTLMVNQNEQLTQMHCEMMQLRSDTAQMRAVMVAQGTVFPEVEPQPTSRADAPPASTLDAELKDQELQQVANHLHDFVVESKEEKVEAIRKLTSNEVTIIQHAFDRYDLDCSGTMNSAAELEQLATNVIFKLGFGVSPEVLHQIVEGCEFGDVENNPLTLEEFIEKFEAKGMHALHMHARTSVRDLRGNTHLLVKSKSTVT